MRRFILFLVICFSLTSSWADTNKIGSLRKVSGNGSIQRVDGSGAIKAVDGLAIFQNDTITTKEKSSLGIIFNDGSRISLGPQSKLIVSKYIFNPSKKKYSMLTKMMKGTASYVSGKMSKLSPESVSIETPDATIGSRGTSFLITVKDR
jgi:hypothetical protein